MTKTNLNEFNKILKIKQDHEDYNPVTLKEIYDYTHIDFNKADYILTKNFTYNQIKKLNQYNNMVVISIEDHRWKRRRWQEIRTWLYIDGKVELLPVQFSHNAWNKGDCEDLRKGKHRGDDIVNMIICSDTIQNIGYIRKPYISKDYFDKSGYNFVEARTRLDNKLRAIKNNKDVEGLKNYKNRAIDILNAHKLVRHIDNLLKDIAMNRNTYELIKKCGDINLDYRRINDYINQIETLKGYYGDVDTLSKYQNKINNIDNYYLNIINIIEA